MMYTVSEFLQYETDMVEMSQLWNLIELRVIPIDSILSECSIILSRLHKKKWQEKTQAWKNCQIQSW